jgi:hypothetical protein
MGLTGRGTRSRGPSSPPDPREAREMIDALVLPWEIHEPNEMVGRVEYI